jgi:hypothetical protein
VEQCRFVPTWIGTQVTTAGRRLIYGTAVLVHNHKLALRNITISTY